MCLRQYAAVEVDGKQKHAQGLLPWPMLDLTAWVRCWLRAWLVGAGVGVGNLGGRRAMPLPEVVGRHVVTHKCGVGCLEPLSEGCKGRRGMRVCVVFMWLRSGGRGRVARA